MPSPKSTHCKNGHERAVVGFYLRPNEGKNGKIRCKACKSATSRRTNSTHHGQMAQQRRHGWGSRRTRRRREARIALYEG